MSIFVGNLSNSHISGNIVCITHNMFTYESESVHGCNFNSLIKLKDFSTSQGHRSHINYKCGNISETVQDRVVVTTDH